MTQSLEKKSLVVGVIPENITPNMLSWGRILAIPIIWILYLLSPLVSFVVYTVACITDWIDGRLARERGLSTASGKRLDEVADKSLVTGVVLVLFADGILRFSIDSVMFWVVVVIIARDLIVTAIRTFWQEEAKKIPSLFLAKIKTFALMPAIGLLLYSGGGYMFHLHAVWLGFALLWIALIAALISGIQYSILFFRGR